MEKPFLLKILDWYVLKMIDKILIKKYVIKRSRKLNKSVTVDINKKIYEFENMFVPDYWIRFSYIKDGFTTLLNGKAVNPNGILLTPEWAARLLLLNDDDTITAFLITIGHEMTHNEGDFSTNGFQGKNKKFISWTNEVHADFCAAQKMVDSSKERLLLSMDYKIKLKLEQKNNFMRRFMELSHPSWHQRKSYVEIGSFNKALIEMIARQTGCTNKELINDIATYYRDIILKE